MQDNPGLDKAIRARYEKLYTGIFYKRYVQGLWCLADGLIYQFDPDKHLVTQAPAGGRYYIREYYYCGRDRMVCKTDQEYYTALEELAGDLPVGQVIVDPSAASFIALIRSHGRFCVRKARNDVLSGIHLVSSLLQSGKLGFMPCCADTLREFSLYSWMSDGSDRPLKENDHAMDDIRYFCSTVMRRI